MRILTILSCLAALGAVAAAGGAAAGAAAAADPDQTWAPPPHTITSVTGTADHGFHVEYYDGTEEFTPTNSEAAAECGEYDTRLARVRCRVETRTWYRGLADVRRALRYAGMH